jgi:glycosyltransferase involved in cell wall biosynthesis
LPKISIIVTAYNIEAYIRQSLECVLNQTIRDIEVIVVDDGSTDTTPAIIREYAKIDSRIIPILFDENTIGGVATAANAGMDVATGDFIAFADGDDIYDPKMFARLYDAAIMHSADLAMCNYQLLDTSTGQLEDPADIDRWRDYTQDTVIDLNDTTRRVMLKFISVPWRKIYSRDLVERINLRFPVGDYFFEDNPFHWASIIGGQRLVIVPESLCQHRVARVGQTMATVDSRLLRIFKHHDNIRDWLREYGHDQSYSDDLLGWTANQLSWVSQRAEGSLIGELYDVLRPVIDQYSTETINAFGDRNGRGRTFLMLSALKSGNLTSFTTVATTQSQNNSDKPTKESGAIASRSDTLVSRGLFHLKNSGLRETMHMTGRYVSTKTGFGPFNIRSRPSLDKPGVTNEDLFAAMIIMQRDIRDLRSEIAVLLKNTANKEKQGID